MHMRTDVHIDFYVVGGICVRDHAVSHDQTPQLVNLDCIACMYQIILYYLIPETK